jgi:sugar O-acyltransferase (sialic acid O-acetyltransferase NeuD family)
MSNTTQDLVIWGCGGFGREVLQVAQDLNEDKKQFNILGFLEGNSTRIGDTVHDLPILGDQTWLAKQSEVAVVVAIGNTAVRRRVVRSIEAACSVPRFATLIHPQSWIGRRVQIGEGAIICAGTSVTTDIVIGQNVILNLHCTVGHDACVKDFVTAAPGVHISGAVTVGEGCDLGTGAVVIQGVEVGPWSIIGAGAVVVRALPANVTAVGAPARAIKQHLDGWHL